MRRRPSLRKRIPCSTLELAAMRCQIVKIVEAPEIFADLAFDFVVTPSQPLSNEAIAQPVTRFLESAFAVATYRCEMEAASTETMDKDGDMMKARILIFAAAALWFGCTVPATAQQATVPDQLKVSIDTQQTRRRFQSTFMANSSSTLAAPCIAACGRRCSTTANSTFRSIRSLTHEARRGGGFPGMTAAQVASSRPR